MSQTKIGEAFLFAKNIREAEVQNMSKYQANDENRNRKTRESSGIDEFAKPFDERSFNEQEKYRNTKEVDGNEEFAESFDERSFNEHEQQAYDDSEELAQPLDEHSVEERERKQHTGSDEYSYGPENIHEHE
jgi:hypothetical protein